MKLRTKTNLRVYDIMYDVDTTFVPHKDDDGVVDYIDMYIKVDGDTYLEERFMPIDAEQFMGMLNEDSNWSWHTTEWSNIDEDNEEEDEADDEEEEFLIYMDYAKIMADIASDTK